MDIAEDITSLSFGGQYLTPAVGKSIRSQSRTPFTNKFVYIVYHERFINILNDLNEMYKNVSSHLHLKVKMVKFFESLFSYLYM